jgi:hypothetical protein
MKPSTFLELDTSKRKVKIKKLTDNEFSNLARNKFAAIFEDYFFLMLLDRLYSKYKFTLAKIYTALYGLYGLHNGYDDYKGSFAYCFRLTIQADERTFTYLLHLRDIKGNPPYFTFYRELGKAEADKKGTYVQPIEADFSKEAMQEFMSAFVGYLIGYFNVIQPTFKKNFFRTVPYTHTIYGFKKGAFFQDCYYHEDYEADSDEEEADYERDYGYSDYREALQTYKNASKMNGKMSQRYD